MIATGWAPLTATLRYASASASCAPGVRVEVGEPAVAVGGQRDAEVGRVVDPQHPGVLGLGEHRVARGRSGRTGRSPRTCRTGWASRPAAAACRPARRRRTAGPGARRRWPGPRPASPAGRTAARRPGRRAPPSAGSTSTMVSPCQSMISRSPSVTSPTTVACTSHLRQIARNASTSPGSTTAIIRSCDSLIRISSGLSVGSRSGTTSRSTCMPPSPAAASSEVAQEMPAAPKSWMPVISLAANSSSVHSISSFSMNGSPTWTAGRFDGLVGRRRSPRPGWRPRRCRPHRSRRRTG